MKSMAHRPHRTALAYIVTLIVMVVIGALQLWCLPDHPTLGELNRAFFGAFIPAVFAGLLTYVLR